MQMAYRQRLDRAGIEIREFKMENSTYYGKWFVIRPELLPLIDPFNEECNVRPYLHPDGTWQSSMFKPGSNEVVGYFDTYDLALETVLKAIGDKL